MNDAANHSSAFEALPSNWKGSVPISKGFLERVSNGFKHYDVILRPDADAPEWWAGAPSVVRDAQGVFWLASRMRTADAPRGRRGYEIRILRSTDGIHFETAHRIRREDVPVVGFERPALVSDPKTGKIKLYGCCCSEEGVWSILKFDDADSPADIVPATGHLIIQPPARSYARDRGPSGYKDPVMLCADGVCHCYTIGIVCETERIFHFVSEDGEQWRPADNPYDSIMPLTGWHDFYVRPASILPIGIGYLFVYEGSNVKWYDPVYHIATGLGFTFDLKNIIDLTPDAPLLTSTTPSPCFHTWRYSCWMWVGQELWIYAEVSCPNQTNEIRLFRIPRE